MEWLYLEDSYVKEFEAKVLDIEENKVFLNRSAFYPGGGGQPHDTGILIYKGRKYKIVGMEKEAHLVEGNPPPSGINVKGIIDWDRRYRIMRAHTAVHIISGVAFKKFGVVITGNQLYEGSARMDLSFESMSKELALKIIEDSNTIVEKSLPVRTYYIEKEEFLKRKDLMRVNPKLYEKYDRIRIVEIENFDAQADGGTHVKNTSEVGKIVLKKYESKGRKNKRIYIQLEDNE